MIEFHADICAWPCVFLFRTYPHALVDYLQEISGLPLHEAVGVNCNKGATTENQCADA